MPSFLLPRDPSIGDTSDVEYYAAMERCLTLAEYGRGTVGINPMVGAILVRNGKIIAEGWHHGFGLPHAERDLLERAYTGSIKSEDTVYVNLEPCCHHGKTPPCTDILIERGVRHVIYGMRDPNPLVAGKGIEQLRKVGIQVQGPLLRERCAWLNRGYVSFRTAQRPWITLKRAQTRDGLIANPDGSPKKITSKEQDAWSHTWLRAKHDAILVGVGTINADNPKLDTRFAHSMNTVRDQNMNKKVDQKNAHPLRIILDPNLRISFASIVLTDDQPSSTIVICADPFPHSSLVDDLRYRGIRILPVKIERDRIDWSSLWSSLLQPADGYCGITSILLEGGPRTWEYFKASNMLDEEVVLIGR